MFSPCSACSYLLWVGTNGTVISHQLKGMNYEIEHGLYCFPPLFKEKYLESELRKNKSDL